MALEQSVDGVAVVAQPVCMPCVWCDSPAGWKVSQGNMFVELDSSLFLMTAPFLRSFSLFQSWDWESSFPSGQKLSFFFKGPPPFLPL